MCLTVKSGCKIEIAEKPIVCRKIVFHVTDNIWESWLMRYKYEYNIELLAKDHIEIDKNNTINIGFHAFLNTKEREDIINKIINPVLPVLDPLISVFAIIPKGSEYCLGNNEDIVANKMIVFSSKEELDKYLKTNENI